MSTETEGGTMRHGQRVQIPVCDLWMRGARYGTVLSVDQKGIATVKMDHPEVKQPVRFALDRLTAI